MRIFPTLATLAVAFALAGGSVSAAHRWGLKEGTPDVKSAGQLAFGPEGILFIGDSQGSAIFAVETGDVKGEPAKVSLTLEKLGDQLGTLFGGASSVNVNDMAVNPLSGNVYLSVSRGDAKTPGIARIDAAGKLTEVALKNVNFLKAELPNPPEDKITGEGPRARNRRNEAVTDLAFVDGKVLVAGVTSDAGSSRVRELPFPFVTADTGTNVEIYHAAHGRVEDNAAIRTFVPFNIDGQPSLLAGFTCTPLVRFPIESLEPGKKVRGTTVAELGNRNIPLDMVVYEKEGKKYLLMANNNRGVMKIATDDIGRKEGLTEPVSGGGTAGQKFETIKDLEGTVQLDRLNDTQAIVLVKNDAGLTLKTVALP